MKLNLRCPVKSCSGYVHPVEAGTEATTVCDRRCRKCQAHWRLVIYPLSTVLNGQGFAHKLSWTCTKDGKLLQDEALVRTPFPT